MSGMRIKDFEAGGIPPTMRIVSHGDLVRVEALLTEAVCHLPFITRKRWTHVRFFDTKEKAIVWVTDQFNFYHNWKNAKVLV